MNKKRIFGLLGIMMAIFVAATCFSGLAYAKSTDQTLVYNTSTDPKTLDPALNEAVDGAIIITAIGDGLTRYDGKSRVYPAISDKWTVSKDQLTWTFHIRSTAKWSDGKPVTAGDFEYAWKRLLDPKLAATYSYQLFYLKNGENYFNGKAKIDDVGVKAKDDSTLVVTLNAPCPYFTQVTALPNLFPVRKDIVEKDYNGWANKVENLVSDGPFKVVKWTHNDSIELDKNTTYWNASKIKLNHITMVMVNDQASAVAAFQRGDMDVNWNPPPSDQVPSLLKSKQLSVYGQYGTYYIDFQNQKAPFNNPKVRMALSLAINRQTIVDALKAGNQPATAMVSPGSMDSNNKDFFDNHKPYYPVTGDVAKAKKLLAEAGYPNGKGFPKVTYLYNTLASHKMIAEMVQEMWKKNLGINVQLQNQEWKVFQATRVAGNYTIARDGWIGDYLDPMTFLDMFTKLSGNNNAKYNNPKYDALIKSAKADSNPVTRMKTMHKAEDMLMNDAGVAPLYYYNSQLMIKPNVKGLYETATGTVYFDETSMQ